jgi:Kef-type K+ transport system membrane component KefB
MEPLSGISHGDLLKLVASVAILLGSARLLGELATRMHIPAVVGEILAGVLLGPSLLSGFFPRLEELILPQTSAQMQLLELVGLFGIMFLLIVIGLETDLALIRTRLRTAVGVGLGGLIVPFASGLAVGAIIPEDLLADPGQRQVFTLFLAVALALSAIPVLAKILADLGLMRREFGQTALAAGMIDDILGWSLLGMVTSLASAGQIDLMTLATTLGAVLVFLLATILVARPLSKWSLRIAQDRMQTKDRLLTLVIVLAFAWGGFSHALHLEPILGAFAIGIIFGQSRRLPLEVNRQLESVTYGVFAPIFLATAGLRLDIGGLLEPRLLRVTLLLLVVAAAGKIIGAYAGARLVARSNNREALAYGLALNARGVLGIIVASIGLTMGIFSVEIYSMMVLVSVVTSLVAPIGVRLALGARYLSEYQEKPEWLGGVRRVLMPVRPRTEAGSDVQTLEAAVLARLASDGLAVTLLAVVDRGSRKEAARLMDRLGGLFPPTTEITRRLVGGSEPSQAIVTEAEKGYDLVVLGAPETLGSGEHVFSAVVDEVVRLAPCPTLVFRAGPRNWPPRRIMVPTGGTASARRAAELAFALAQHGVEVLALHVVDTASTTGMATGRSSSPAVRLDIGQEVVDDIRRLGETFGVHVETEVMIWNETASGVVDRAREDIDLIVIGTAVRAGTQQLYLGPRVEQLLAEAPCPVIILNT